VGIVTCANDPHGSLGFCLLNNLAIGAAYAVSTYRAAGAPQHAASDLPSQGRRRLGASGPDQLGGRNIWRKVDGAGAKWVQENASLIRTGLARVVWRA
jgi:hypothetical protein